MAAIPKKDLQFLEDLSQLTFCNPFLPERVELEQRILGKSNRKVPAVWNFSVGEDAENWANTLAISEMIGPVAESLLKQLESGVDFDDHEIQMYEDLVLYLLYDKYRPRLKGLMVEFAAGGCHQKCEDAWREFLVDLERFRQPALKRFQLLNQAEHLWACYFQILRAFHHVFYCIVGSSVAAARLRASIWQSLLTHNLRRYVHSLHKCMHDIPTLITGPSGSGKELVARAISLSQYIPFDSKKGEFVADYASAVFAVNLAALSPTLIESELFGHRKGSFTGATEDRKGMFEACEKTGTVFLDEIGELDESIQVKLLRVLQNRTFQRLGDLTERKFSGKLIAATNRDFAKELNEGNFRTDLYYRLCADMIQTPSLEQQLSDNYDDLKILVVHLADQLSCLDGAQIGNEACEWIEANLGRHYSWPGNVRELEQCLRNFMIRGVYCPVNQSTANTRQQIVNSMLSGEFTAEQLLEKYCTMIYSQTGSYEEAARRLEIDRRTVKRKVNEQLLEELRRG